MRFERTKTEPTQIPKGGWTQKSMTNLQVLHARTRMRPYNDDKSDAWVPNQDGECQQKTAHMMQELVKMGVPKESMRGYVGTVYQGKGKPPLTHAWLVIRTTADDGSVVDLISDIRKIHIDNRATAKDYIWSTPDVMVADD